MKPRTIGLIAAASVIGGAHAAFADGTGATNAELLARIEALEAAAASRPDLGFNIGENTSITIYGFVRAEAFYDFDFEQGDTSNLAGLDTATPTDGTFNTSLRVSRLGFRVASDTDIGPVGGQLEFDLFGSGGTAELRLRHANVTVGGFLVGQFWTNFMPISLYPTTADFNGPVGITFARLPQVRYSSSFGEVDYSVSIEEAAWESRDPVLTAAAEYSDNFFTARAAGLVGTIVNGAEDEDVYAVGLSGQVRPWQGGQFTVNYTLGEGIGDLLIGGGSGVADGEANGVNGLTVEYRQDVAQRFNVGVAYGREDYDAPGAEDLSEVQTVHVNGFYRPTDNISVGLEYIYGERTSGTGVELDANRIGASFTFSF